MHGLSGPFLLSGAVAAEALSADMSGALMVVST